MNIKTCEVVKTRDGFRLRASDGGKTWTWPAWTLSEGEALYLADRFTAEGINESKWKPE